MQYCNLYASNKLVLLSFSNLMGVTNNTADSRTGLNGKIAAGHEWIVGPSELHETHRVGTEPYHEGRPNEVSLPPYATRTTILTFDQAGTFAFICHLPGHEAYGMVGQLTAV